MLREIIARSEDVGFGVGQGLPSSSLLILGSTRLVVPFCHPALPPPASSSMGCAMPTADICPTVSDEIDGKCGSVSASDSCLSSSR